MQRKSIKIVRLFIFLLIGTLIAINFPIPSQRMPNAKLRINEIGNIISASVTEFIAYGVMDPNDKCVSSETELIVSTNSNENKLTYRYDNIVAIGLCLFCIIICYDLLVNLFSLSIKLMTLGWCSWIAAFCSLFILRAAIFGILIVNYDVRSFVPFFDNPFRIVLLLIPSLIYLLCVASKQKQEDI